MTPQPSQPAPVVLRGQAPVPKNEKLVQCRVIGQSFAGRFPQEGEQRGYHEESPLVSYPKGSLVLVPESVASQQKGVLQRLDEPAPGVQVPQVTDVGRIGRAQAKLLATAGIHNLPLLAESTAPKVCAAIGVSEKVATEVIEEAKKLWAETLEAPPVEVEPIEKPLPDGAEVRKVGKLTATTTRRARGEAAPTGGLDEQGHVTPDLVE